jgi:class 3 adenylate cyclase
MPGQTRPHVKSLDAPDETLAFPLGSAETVKLGEMVIGRVTQQPGWRWSEHIKPIAGTELCQFHHIGVAIAGTSMFRMEDGTEGEIKAGDVFDVPPGHDAWVTSDEPAVGIIWGGWRGWGKPPVGDRIVTTLLLTDIAGSTALAARVGDSAWDQLLEQHNERVREVLERYRGNEVATTGDGFLAAFDGAARALLAASGIRTALDAMGMGLRAAVHTGEVEVVPGNLRGMAIHETARILALADAGEILVSSTTHELASSAGLAFVDRGTHKLKGVPTERRVFALSDGATAE